ncbi:MAG: hypothetical protein U1E58_08660 [Tabrizicola sp.]
MRQLAPILALTFTLSSPVLAEDLAGNATAMLPSGIPFNTSISLNLPLTATDSTGRQAEEDNHRKAIYARSVRECDLLLDSVAKPCVITGISVSTQITTNPGQPDYLYVSSNISMQVELK